ncbi:MAG: MFS transporter [Rhodocyclaceae bacterium]|nr:MFS transporter [Rhodocyclaceae bacterium]
MSAELAQPQPQAPGRDGSIIGLVGVAHGISHFYHLLLPPLFPWLMADFHLDFTRVGATMTVFFVVSGVGQALAGILVDRFGPVRVLAAGMGCFLLAGVGLSLATSYGGLLAVAALAGLGNSVFHPADYTLLNRRVSHARLGHAFSVHGLSGNLGWALAPVFLTGLTALAGWRVAGLCAGLLALPMIGLFLMNRDWLEGESLAPAQGETRHGTFDFLKVGAVWMCFAFFFFLTAAFGGIQNFSSPILESLYGLSRGVAAAILSSYMLGSAAGILVGGFLAKHRSQDRIIAVALLSAAACASVLAMGVLPAWAILPVMVGIGFFSGTAGPSRDLLVRRAATSRFGQAAYGRIYGFVYSGLDTGLAVAPLIFGGFMDRGQFGSVLLGIALLQGVAVLTALRVGKSAGA